MELILFSDSHLASKFFKVVANSKKLVTNFKDKKTFFYAVSLLDKTSKIEPGKGSLTCYKRDTRMDDIQRSSSPKSKMASSYRSRCMCRVLETNLTRKFAANLSLKIFLVKISTQTHTFVKQICFPNGNVLFLSLFSPSRN